MSAEPYDEETIGAEDTVIRRINLKQHVIWDPNTKRNRISSKAYNKSSGLTDGMSVDLEALIVADSVEAKAFVTTPIYTGSVAFSASSIRDLGLWIGFDPIKDVPGVPNNPYHGEVWAKTAKKSFSEAEKSGLAKAARWYVELEDVDLT